jgi:hypothetical protein
MEAAFAGLILSLVFTVTLAPFPARGIAALIALSIELLPQLLGHLDLGLHALLARGDLFAQELVAGRVFAHHFFPNMLPTFFKACFCFM